WRNFLLNVGNGENNILNIPDEMLCQDDLIEQILGDISNQSQMTDLVNRAILTPKNSEALDISNRVLERMQGCERVYTSVDDADCDEGVDSNNFQIEFLNTMTPQGYPPHELHIKKGAIVMLLRNLRINRGLCNGTRLLVED